MLVTIRPAAVAVAVLRDGLRPKVPQSAPTDYVEIMQEAWDGEPRARPSIFDISNRLSRLATRFHHSRKQVSWLPLIGRGEEEEEVEYAQEEHSSNSSGNTHTRPRHDTTRPTTRHDTHAHTHHINDM
jgi:hypothetical protein